jgi:hypothetical protein
MLVFLFGSLVAEDFATGNLRNHSNIVGFPGGFPDNPVHFRAV